MTPFGIRKKIKALLGLGGAEAPQKQNLRPQRPKVTLVLVGPDGQEQVFEGDAGSSPLYISGNMAKPIASGCNDSSCSTCRIEVLEGEENLSPRSAREAATLKANNRPEQLRLACCSEILKGTVKVRAFEYVDV